MSKRRQFGSIRRLPSGRWQARYRDPLTGQRWVPAPTTFASKGDASRWLAALESGGVDPVVAREQRRGERLGQYADEWIATRQLSPRTRELYELQLRLHIVPALGDAKVSMLEPRHIRAWHSGLLGGHLGEVSVAKVYRLLRSILNSAVEDGLLQRNPCQIKGAGVERSPERAIPTIEHIRAISDELPGRFAAVPWVAALAALRKGELFGLARMHVDFAAGTLRVERSLQEQTGKGAVLKEPKTTSSRRTVGMPRRLVVILAEHFDSYVDDGPEALVFTNARRRSGASNGVDRGVVECSNRNRDAEAASARPPAPGRNAHCSSRSDDKGNDGPTWPLVAGCRSPISACRRGTAARGGRGDRPSSLVIDVPAVESGEAPTEWS